MKFLHALQFFCQEIFGIFLMNPDLEIGIHTKGLDYESALVIIAIES